VLNLAEGSQEKNKQKWSGSKKVLSLYTILRYNEEEKTATFYGDG
jgi:hypothetical protein